MLLGLVHMKTENQILGVRLLIFISLIFCAFQLCTNISPPESRGKLIYTNGVRVSGEPINAKLSGANFDAKILPCINCHGEKGQGNPEGGIIPSKVDWSNLTKSYNIEFQNGRSRKAYDLTSLRQAIVDGVDPSGNKLDEVMPRYSLNDEDIQDLVAYLKIIKSDASVGLSDSTVQIGIILPSLEQPSGKSKAIFDAVTAYLDLVNSSGGVYNRKFILKPLYLKIRNIKNDQKISEFLSKNDLFALISSDLKILSKTSLSVIQETQIPVIGAISGNPNKQEYHQNHFYYLLPSMAEEINELIRFRISLLRLTRMISS